MTISKSAQTKKTKPSEDKPKRLKKCHYCEERNIPYGDMRTFCFKNECITHHNAKTKLKKNRKALKEFKDGDIPHLTKVAQQVFNKYIRKRDEELPCISCQHKNGMTLIYSEDDELEYAPSKEATQRQRHAGHFRPVGRNHQMRFNEDNAHSQCSICNNHLSGNLVPYREALIVKIGIGRVEALESNNTSKSYSVEELQEIIKKYKQKEKELDNERV